MTFKEALTEFYRIFEDTSEFLAHMCTSILFLVTMQALEYYKNVYLSYFFKFTQTKEK